MKMDWSCHKAVTEKQKHFFGFWLKILRRKLFLRNKIKKEQVEDKRFDKDYKFASSAVSVQYIDPNFVS